MASTVTLAIRNTADNIVREYEEANDLVGTISFNRQALSDNFKGGEDARKENIEAFNNVEQIKKENVLSYGDSDYLKGYYYLYATSLNSDTLTKATDTFEYEVEDKNTSTKTETSTTTKGEKPKDMPNVPGRPGEKPGETYEVDRFTHTETTITITKRKEKFESSRNLTGDFKIYGYSSFDAMDEFVSGDYKIIDGEMIEDLDTFDCVINSELATLNELEVGSTIKLKNPTTKTEYEFNVVGIYKDNTDSNDVNNMYSESVNTIITGYGVVDKMVEDDSTLVTNITPTFILKDASSIELFETELKEKGLNEYYALNTNLDELEGATKSINNVSNFATTFLIITLAIVAIILFIINMINIRERKYEIGVFRTIGLSKFKLTTQFVMELLFVAIVSLFIGAGIGAATSTSVGNYLLENEITGQENANKEIEQNFGRGQMPMEFNMGVQIEQIDSIEAVVDYKVILELFGIGVALTLVSSLASMVSIQRFSPLTILKERS